jgi:tetratricopeptide (TPR) repeat protein
MLLRRARPLRVLSALLLVLTFGSNVAAQAAAPATTAPGATGTGKTEDEARAYFLLGRSFHDKGEFAKAAEQFELAYAASGRPALLYNLFVAYRDANDAKHAADALRRYLALEQNVENRPQLEAKLEAMDAALAAQVIEEAANPQTPPAQDETRSDEPQPVPVSDVEPMVEPEESSFPIGPVIVIGVGGAMMLGSIATGLMASGAQSDLEKECPTRMSCGADLEDTASKGETMALVTDVLLFGGIAVAAGGAAWLLLGSGNSSESASARDATHASVMCTDKACAANVRGTF